MTTRTAEPSRAPAVRRAGWGILDQALSSLTNFALAIVLAQRLDLPEFGAAGISFAAYLIAANASRALTTEPLTVRYSGLSRAAWRPAAASAVGSSLVIGLAAGALCVAVGVGLGGVVGLALIALGLTMPGLLVQDAWRFAFFAEGRPRSAFVNDLAWAILLVPALLAALALGEPTPWPYILAWGISGTCAAVVGLAQARLVPAPLRFRAWFDEHRDIAPRYLVEFVVLSGATQIRLVLVAAIADLSLVGALRGGQVLFGALHPLTYGLQLTLVPDAVRAARQSVAALRRRTIALAAGLAVISAGFGLALFLLPDEIGRVLLGRTWDDARPTIAGQTLVMASAAVSLGALVGLRALAAAGRSMRARILASAIGIIGAVVGATTRDPALCAAWIGVAVALGAIVWWREYLVALRLATTAGETATEGELLRQP